MTHAINNQTATLEHLFTANLAYQDDVAPLIPSDIQDVVLVGNGDGTVTGEKINGSVHWSLFSGDCAYVYVRAGVEPPPEQHLCTVYPVGIIQTEDSAKIWFDAKGYGLRGYDASQPHWWKLTMAIHLTTTDDRYQWVNNTLGVLVSHFDEKLGRAQWDIYIPSSN